MKGYINELRNKVFTGKATNGPSVDQNTQARNKQMWVLGGVGAGIFCFIALAALFSHHHKKEGVKHTVSVPQFAPVVDEDFDEDADGEALAKAQASIAEAKQTENALSNKINQLMQAQVKKK